MIHFNEPEYNNHWIAKNPLRPEEEMEVINFINSLITKSNEEHNTERLALLQRFVNHYENLSQFFASRSKLPDDLVKQDDPTGKYSAIYVRKEEV